MDLIALAPVQIVADRAWNSRQSAPSEASEAELTASIRDLGLLQPLRVRRIGAEWSLVFGFRRHGACLRINPSEPVPCSVMPSTGDREADDLLASLENLSENVQRESLFPWEIAAKAYEIHKTFGKRAPEIAALLKLSAGYIANLIRLREKLCPELWTAFCERPAVFVQRYLLEICALPHIEQVEAYNEAYKSRKGGRPAGAKTGSSLAKKKKDVARRLQKETNPRRKSFLEGAAYALSGSWDLSAALGNVGKQEEEES